MEEELRIRHAQELTRFAVAAGGGGDTSATAATTPTEGVRFAPGVVVLESNSKSTYP